jgi:hypothetical protein
MKDVLKVLVENRGYGYPLEEIADKVDLKDFSRESSARASLSRCLNMLDGRGLVAWFYDCQDVQIDGKVQKVPQKHLGKFWIISADALNNVELQQILEQSKTKKKWLSRLFMQG